MAITRKIITLMGGIMMLATAVPALAEIETIGAPKPGQMGFQPAVTDIMEQTVWFHNDILMPMVVVPISVFVGLLMVFVLWRFRAKKNPTPRQFSHNTLVEVAWTLIPAVVVFVIAIIGVRQVYFQDAPPEDLAGYSGVVPEEGEVVLKATGNRWYWDYAYPDEGIEFSSNIVPDEELTEGQPRLLAVDNHVVLPVNTVVRLQVTANPADVLHAWTIPAFGVKIDAVPGRLNERWFRVLPGFEGRYYGQCSELCGERHAYMPITVDVVSPAKYEAWLTEQKIELGLLEATPAAVETPADITPVEAESVDAETDDPAAEQPDAVEDSPADISIPETNNNAAPAAVQDEAAE